GMGNIQFQDPWYVLSDGSQPGNYWINVRGFYEPTGKEGAQEKGVFLNQGLTQQGQWVPPYYSVKAISPQDITFNDRTHKFYFQGWSASPPNSAEFQNANALETPVVFKQAGAVVSANFKGSMISNSENALSTSSQRKVVRTSNGNLHVFYVSMGKLWYEKSVNNGNTFYAPKLVDEFVNNFSVDYVNNRLYLIAQLRDESSSSIRLYEIDENANVRYFPDEINSQIFLIDETIEAMPVVGANYGNILFIWKTSNAEPLKMLRFRWDGSRWEKSNEIDIPNTTGKSINPTLSLVKSEVCSKVFTHFVWEERNGSRSSELYYTKITMIRDYVNDNRFENYTKVTTGSGYELTTKPVVVETGENTALIGFVGMKRFEDENITPLETRAVLVSIPSNGVFYSFGDDVQSVSLNRCNTRWTFAWTRGNDLPVQYVDSRDIRTIYQLGNLKGVDVHITNGIVPEDMYAFVINTSTLPYPINYRAIYGNILPEQIVTEDSREGIVSKEGAEVYYSIGDVKVGDQKIEFEEIPDTVGMITLENANRYLISKPFMVNDNSGFVYSVRYGVTDSSALKEALTNTDYIKFRVELIDYNTKELLGIFDEVTYNSESVSKYENISYSVNTMGLGERLVQLRLVITNNVDPYYSLSDKFGDAEYNLQKKGAIKQISYRGMLGEKVYSYELIQNYPNPFNPVTKIRYSVKETKPVMIKLYDIVGREIATLLNEVKDAGEYEIELDAGKLGLTSGVYFYQMKAGEYTSIKKMVLLK
ncbi:MAG: T9SS type A sorting domain-containing protein, partial [Myxococcota bacterium]